MEAIYQKLVNSINPSIVTVQEIWPPKPILWIEKNASISVALKLLNQNRILSLPVIDSLTNQSIGVIDVMDITFYVVAKFPSPDAVTFEELSTLEWNGVYFMKNVTVFEVIAFSKTFSFSNLPEFPIFATSYLSQLIQTFASGVHRVPVLHLSRLVNYISQTDLLRFLAENIFALKDKAFRSVQELGIYRELIHFVRSDLTTIKALSFMVSKRVSAVPILDSNGFLIGNISASDLRGISEADFPHFLEPILTFLNHFSPKSLFPLTCKPFDTLEHVIFKMVATHVHRLWCVDPQNRILGVISMTDIFRCFFMDISPMEF